MSNQSRFDEKYIPVTESGCWIWIGGSDKRGRGGIWDDEEKKVKFAHRMSLELVGIRVPEDKCVCHKCDIPACVNPDHLFIGTQQDNIDDMMRKGRNRVSGAGIAPSVRTNKSFILKGEDCYLSKLNEDQVRAIRLDRRTHQAIADEYGMSRQAISHIKIRDTWKHVE